MSDPKIDAARGAAEESGEIRSRALHWHSAPVHCGDFSPDGTLVV